MKLKNLLKFAQDHRNDTETNCGACGLFFDDSQADKEGLHLPEFCDAVEFPSYEEMIKALEKSAPEGWIISDEYHFIGVNHSALTNEQFIAFGDVNKYYGFNDTNADTVCGDMRELTNPEEIAKSFWFQLGEFYPELFKKEGE